MRRGRRRNTAEGVVLGLSVMALGVVFLLGERGMIGRPWFWTWWEWWPAILIAFGLVRLVRPDMPRDVGSGVSMVLFGLWFFANINHWYGLNWHNSWPLALVAVGAGMMSRAIASAIMRGYDEKEESHG